MVRSTTIEEIEKYEVEFCYEYLDWEQEKIAHQEKLKELKANYKYHGVNTKACIKTIKMLAREAKQDQADKDDESRVESHLGSNVGLKDKIVLIYNIKKNEYI